MTALNEHGRVVLMTDLPAEKLTAGDVGTIVHVHEGRKAYEFVALDGETMAVVTVDAHHVRAVQHREITHARRVA